MQKNIVAIAYTTKLFADGLESIINDLEDFHVEHKTPIGTELAKDIESKSPAHFLIYEVNCPSLKDLDYIRKLLESNQLLRIILLSHLPRTDIGFKLLDSGISSYLLNSCSREDLLSAFNKIINGKPYFCSDITKKLFSRHNNKEDVTDYDLTEREKEILSLLVSSHTNRQIAGKLNLSENTVKTHRRNIQAKFGVSNIIGMVRFACRTNLIDFGDDGYCNVCPYVN